MEMLLFIEAAYSKSRRSIICRVLPFSFLMHQSNIKLVVKVYIPLQMQWCYYNYEPICCVFLNGRKSPDHKITIKKYICIKIYANSILNQSFKYQGQRVLKALHPLNAAKACKLLLSETCVISGRTLPV